MARGKRKWNKGSKAAGAFPAYDAKPIPNAKSKPDKPELDGIDSTDGLVPGMQKALNHARRMEGRLHRLLRDKQTAQEQWEQYKKDSQKAFLQREVSLPSGAGELRQGDCVCGDSAEGSQRATLCCGGPCEQSQTAGCTVYRRRMGSHVGRLRSGTERQPHRCAGKGAVGEDTGASQVSSPGGSSAKRAGYGCLEDYGSQPSTTHGCGSSSRSSSIPGQGSQPLPEKVVPPQGRGCALPGEGASGTLFGFARGYIPQADGQRIPMCQSWALRGQTVWGLGWCQGGHRSCPEPGRAATPFGLGPPPGSATISGGPGKPVHTIPIQVDIEDGWSDEQNLEDPGGSTDKP